MTALIHLLLSFDDASWHLLRCAKIIEKYGLKGTFYLDCKGLSGIPLSDVKWLGDLGEVGSHTLTHSNLTMLDLDKTFHELVESKKVLEKILDKNIESLAYPYGCYNDIIVKLTQKAGYICARTTEPFNISPIQDPFRLKVTLYTDPHAFKGIFKACRELRLSSLLFKPWLIKMWDRLIKLVIEELEKKEGIFMMHILIHPTFIAKRDDWIRFESLISTLSSHDMINLTVSEFVKGMIRGDI
jgi:peptidoglycan/xylan/chitin deacetylase (PgdA/CDA1 family)